MALAGPTTTAVANSNGGAGGGEVLIIAPWFLSPADDVVVDLKGFEVGDSIHISDVTLPKGVTSVITDRDFTIATVIAPSGLKSSEGDTTTADAE